MNHGSLCSGIGGFDLAAEWMGWTNIFSCEKDAKANLVLEKRFPGVDHHKDIFELDAKKYKGQVDIITAGFPCQPFSVAGKRKGENDERFIWSEVLRIIREVKPTYFIGENVAGLVSMENGKTFDKICASLEDEGYTVESFIIPACAVQAWHRRDRVWIIAYHNKISEQSFRCKVNDQREEYKSHNRTDLRDNTVSSSAASARAVYPNTERSNEQGECLERQEEREYRGLGGEQDVTDSDNSGKRTSTSRDKQERSKDKQGRENEPQSKLSGHGETITNPNGKRPQEPGKSRGSMYQEQNSKGKINRAYNDGIWTAESRMGRVVARISNRMDRDINNLHFVSRENATVEYWNAEPVGVPRVANAVPKRTDRLKQLGNAIVPQVAYEIFRILPENKF